MGFDTGLVVVVDTDLVGGFVAVVAFFASCFISLSAFFAAFSAFFVALFILLSVSTLITCFVLGGGLNPSVGAIIMHVTKSITKRNIIERFIPLSNMANSIY